MTFHDYFMSGSIIFTAILWYEEVLNPKLVVNFFVQVLIPKLKRGEIKILQTDDGKTVGLVATQDYDRFVSEVNEILKERSLPLEKHSTKSYAVRMFWSF